MLQRVAFQQFHHDVGLAILLADIMNRAYIGMIQRRGSPRFALESFQCRAVLRKTFGQKFQCHVTTELRVFGLVHHTHPTAAKLLQDLIMTGAKTWSDRCL